MKVIFLDHDGVICLRKQWGKRKSKRAKERGDIFDPFCPKAIKVLNRIIDETNCVIVSSTMWREHCTLEYMQQLFIDRGINSSPIDFTPICDLNDQDFDQMIQYEKNSSWYYHTIPMLEIQCRSKEIKKWLLEFGEHKVSTWVAIDDLPMFMLGDNFIHTPRPSEGIKQCGIADRIIKKLNGE